MAQLMKAAIVHAFGEPLRVQEVQVPAPGPGQILVNIKASGVCHTDLHAADGDWPVKPTLPFIPGHEGVGFVAAVGDGVKVVKEGDRVGVPWLYTACGHCEHCLSGWETLCHDQQNTGYSVNGAYAEYVLADPNYVGHLPPQVSFDEIAPILCAGVTVYKGIRVTDTRPGQWLAISGIGGLGHVAIQYAIAMGLHVVAVDVSADKLALARELGAKLAIDASTTDPAAVIQKEIGGAHGVLVTAVSRGAFAQALGMVRRGGTVALNGLPPGDFPLPIFSTVLNGITVRGSIVGTRRDLQESLEFAAEGRVHARIHRDRLENINAVLADLKGGKIDGRVVLALD
ncbi:MULTISPECIES: alcohol dehydrogenase AdhP [Paraburkholderia]|uniref:alcohol dehydrogenase n=1 Tax=Paraburkholderia madseniana TaxID=2599607 RepID=A0AAP5BAX8_9BURK|nr:MULTISPECIES: alcohol dehydrogenase AdhP [Paraburkholderia]MCX4145252.1 alcohol dehydrogenase AdhP [Paraburkholderia madseniana]MDN7148202.1 alcohol dehydrogenase AdhP [Paraburkholderia sp. WS6]MDQ6407082.1 alcohol dehydrogenase AdhP [Paraburkholderia madseniana]